MYEEHPKSEIIYNENLTFLSKPLKNHDFLEILGCSAHIILRLNRTAAKSKTVYLCEKCKPGPQKKISIST